MRFLRTIHKMFTPVFLRKLRKNTKDICGKGHLILVKERTNGDTPFDRLSKKEGYAQAYEKWDALLTDLEKTRNVKLLAACAEDPNLEVAKKAIALASFQMTEEEKQALRYLAQLRFKPVKEAKNSSEAKLIEITNEYEIKELLADYAHSQGEVDAKTGRFILEMEKMEQMKKAASQMEDRDMATLVEQADVAFLSYLHFREIKEELTKLSKNSAIPENATERKIKEIFTDYTAKRNDLYKKEFINKLGLVALSEK